VVLLAALEAHLLLAHIVLLLEEAGEVGKIKGHRLLELGVQDLVVT
jgi:hypothetical protein